MIGATRALVAREFLRFIRQPSRVLATVGTPAIFWLFLASGFADSFSPPGESTEDASYAAFAIPGIATMVVLFSTIFASISLIQDRQAGLLQAVIVSPASSFAVVCAKVFAGSFLSALQAALVLASGFVIGAPIGPLAFALAFVGCLLVSVALISLGLALAWRVNSTAGFHGIMNLLLMPLWLLSGALFPVEGAAPWLQLVVRLNPLHHATETIADPLGASLVHWAVAIGFALLSFVLATRLIRTAPAPAFNAAIA